jgi:hypothetical protein
MEPTPAAAEPEPVVEAAVDEEFIVETVENPDRTMTFDFQQSPELGDGTHMMLVVSNPFDRHIRYRLGMMTPNSEKIYATSNCPVGPKIKVIEHWPHPIFQLVFTDMKLVDKETDDLSCRQ